MLYNKVGWKTRQCARAQLFKWIESARQPLLLGSGWFSAYCFLGLEGAEGEIWDQVPKSLGL